MKFVKATLFALQIPFVEAFAHSVRDRTYSDAIVVRVEAADGTVGYGEAIARPYVTGETVDSCLHYMVEVLWPIVRQTDFLAPPAEGAHGIDWLHQTAAGLSANATAIATAHQSREQHSTATLAPPSPTPVIAWHAAQTGWELAIVDALLKSQGRSLAHILPPNRSTVTYSGVIGAGSIRQAVAMAKRFRQFGMTELKVKVTGRDDRDRLAAIREVVGRGASLRIDGNGAYTVESAIATCQDLAEFNLDSAEQLVPRCDPVALAQVQAATPITQMADESLITLEDARQLIATQACGAFNLRLAKCGGLAQTIAIAQLAAAAGIDVQVGCQVGETAILSAAGRHLAAWLPTVKAVEGSYGKLLLSQDVGRSPVQFGHRGQAPLLTKPGLGVTVQDEILANYAQRAIALT